MLFEMGNVCSSSQKKKKNSLSHQSEESPSYQQNVRKSIENLSENLILDADSPLTVYNINGISDINSKEETKKNINDNSDNHAAGPNESSDPSVLPSVNTPLHLSILEGKLYEGKTAKYNNKIVISILANNSDEVKCNMNIIYDIYHRLEKKCKANNFELIISDIHKLYKTESKHIFQPFDPSTFIGSALEVITGHAETSNRLQEISRHLSSSYVIPIILLDSSLGTPMLPLTIESQDFTSLVNLASVDEIKLLDMWYKKDESCQRYCYNLYNNNLISSSEKTSELTKLLNVLLKLFPHDLKDTYLTTIAQQEINNTVLCSQELAKRCIWIHNGNFKIPDGAASLLETENIRRITKLYNELKLNLPEKNLIRILDSTKILDKEFITVVENLLDKFITAIIDEHLDEYSIPHNTDGINKQLLQEVELITQYSKIMTRNSSCFDIIDDIKRYIEGPSKYPLIVIGSSGSGKSVLISQLREIILQWNSEIHLIVRYSNLDYASSDITSVIGSIANHLSVLINGSQCIIERDIQNYSKVIANIAENSNLFIVIIIDSCDEIINGCNFDWIPINTNKLKIILSISEPVECSTNTIIQNLIDYGVPDENFIKIKELSVSQWNDVLTLCCTNFSTSQKSLYIPRSILSLTEKIPFTAKALVWLIWLGNSSVQNTDISSILEQIFRTLESKSGIQDLDILLLIIALSKWGIKERDCLAIYQNETNSGNHEVYRIWTKFCWIMRPMIIFLNGIRIADKIFCDGIKARYEAKQKTVHTIIHEYFKKQANTFNPDEKTLRYNCEKFFNLPYHYFHIVEKPTAAIKSQIYFYSYYFIDLQWIMMKVIAVGPLPLLHDIFLAEKYLGICEALHIQILKLFLEKYFNELSYDGNQFITLFKLFLKVQVHYEKIKKNEVLMCWYSFLNEFNMPFLEVLNINFKNLTNGACGGFDALVSLPINEYFVASMSTEREEICIWDVLTCKRVRELRGIPQPTSICPVGEFEAAVLCKREIKVVNFNDGIFKVTLKGVMNQHMPYFGVHDDKHLVCLSRNRMYVNLMNLESGDCVTTFKAGEDRFLNSLLISGDGRILVCGDETQKPFPLLVWHLSQRKLLYDLRIPYHEFLTSLSAITHEGSYVCVVAKELNEPTPNFIVVYDLQSGTLFKKWKPTCNTVSIAISQNNACVIAGLVDAKILIWDLVTGNCRSTLVGHNAPVTFLKLDPLGKVLLSRNKEGRDSSIRIWELSSGISLGVYTPPLPISTCEILPNGIFIILALQNCTNILTLALKNYCGIPNETISVYGHKENMYKVFNLN